MDRFNYPSWHVEISRVESHNSLGVGERCHDPLRQVFEKDIAHHPWIDREVAIRLAVKAINDTMRPEGVRPSFFVYRSLPTFPAVNMEAPKKRVPNSALHATGKQIEYITARLRIQQALCSRLPPASRFHIRPGDMAHVCRENGNGASKKGDRAGPWRVLKIRHKQIYVNWQSIMKQLTVSQFVLDPTEEGYGDIKRMMEVFNEFLHVAFTGSHDYRSPDDGRPASQTI